MDYGIFNVRTDVNACNCTRGCMATVRESALKVDWEKNPLPCRTVDSNQRWQRAGPVLYQLSYTPTHKCDYDYALHFPTDRSSVTLCD